MNTEKVKVLLIVGSGPGASKVASSVRGGIRFPAVVCNRGIELWPATLWVVVDRVHYERSKWHPNARLAVHVVPTGTPVSVGQEALYYDIARGLPCEVNQLFLSGGTLTVAAHLALRQGAKRLVFCGCDAWEESRDRYHAWDGAPLDEAGLRTHRDHLEQTAAGIQALAREYPDVEFLDATEGRQHLGLKSMRLQEFIEASAQPREDKHVQTASAPTVIPQDLGIPRGYGRLAGVTNLDSKQSVLWFEDSAGTLRALRVEADTDAGLAFRVRGQAEIART